MTKELYFEMCEALGSEPKEDEIPVDLEDFPLLVQTAFSIYETLQDEWEFMAGNYIGKRLENVFQVFQLYEVDEAEYLLMYKLIGIIDSNRRSLIRSKAKVTT